TKKLERVLSTPAGAESTGLQGVDDLNGWTYILSSFQHAGEYTSGTVASIKTTGSDVDKALNTAYKNKVAATVGYITGSVKLV
ncbi:MAG TPA: alkaline phosphatase, partial [Burkholderiaceae bacterium]